MSARKYATGQGEVRGPSAGRKAYLVGGGIASLAGAAFLIRDGGMPGEDITIFEETEITGGSLDGAGEAERGYIIRGGRMFNEESYLCTYNLMSSIPSLEDPGWSIRDDMLEFNELVKTHSTGRLLRAGEKIDSTRMGFDARDRMDLLKLAAISEESLGPRRIDDYFQPSFFRTNFWYMWGTMFAFQPWHSLAEFKRYVHRFIHEFPRIDTLAGVRRTRYNQYDSIVLPLVTWLRGNGVRFRMGCRVTDLEFARGLEGKAVSRIKYEAGGIPDEVEVGREDLVFATLGSMTEASSYGSMKSAPTLKSKEDGGAWTLWERLAGANPEFGNPAVFDGDVNGSKWLSFTTTLHDPAFFELMEQLTGNAAGTGGLVTMTDSRWLMSVVLAHQPHFRNQPEGVYVFWGYGLFVDEEGDFVGKPMADCTGEEIMIELLRQLRFDEHIPKIMATANCIPCMMPFITSQFMPRSKGDRPDVIPHGTSNLALIGQYCELADDVVFTVEYSVHSAMAAVYGLLGLENEIPPIYKGQHDPRVLFRALRTMMR